MLKKYEHLVYSAIGLVALFLVLVAANFLVARVPARVDLTDGNLYTLSSGTRKVLRGLESPVRVKLYMSQGEAVPVPLRSFAQRVEDLVREFKAAAGDKIILEKLDPKPDSEIEDTAQLEGIEPQQLASGEQFYLGIAVSCMTSAMTRNQVVAFILSVVVCLFLVLAGFNPVTDLMTRWASPALVDTVAAFSVVTHFDGFQRGVIDAKDLVYFLSVIGFALFATGVIIRGHRAG